MGKRGPKPANLTDEERKERQRRWNREAMARKREPERQRRIENGTFNGGVFKGPLMERLMRRIVMMDDGCWRWVGKSDQIKDDAVEGDSRKQHLVRRLVYTTYTGIDLDAEHILRKLCRTENCVCPMHFDKVRRDEKDKPRDKLMRVLRRDEGLPLG